MKELVGHKIKEMHVSDDQSVIKFIDTDGVEILYIAEGDCCSESWFADIIFNWKFFETLVVDVEELEVPEWLSRLATNDGRCRQDYDEVYGYKLVTATKGCCEIIFRNSSNGYYGGWCEQLNLERTTDYFRNKFNEYNWEQITKDWRA